MSPIILWNLLRHLVLWTDLMEGSGLLIMCRAVFTTLFGVSDEANTFSYCFAIGQDRLYSASSTESKRKGSFLVFISLFIIVCAKSDLCYSQLVNITNHITINLLKQSILAQFSTNTV